MKFYETNNYIVIIYYTDFTEKIRNVRKDNLEHFIEQLNENKRVYDYVITRKVDFEY